MDISEAAAKLRADVQSTIQGEVFRTCEETLRKHVMSDIYGGYSPSYYSRTMGLLNAVEVSPKSVGHSSTNFEVKINASKLGMTPAEEGAPRFGSWGVHMGFSGQDFREGVIAAMENGSSSPYFSHAGRGFYAKTEAELNSKLVQIMASSLRGKGWDVSIG